MILEILHPDEFTLFWQIFVTVVLCAIFFFIGRMLLTKNKKKG